MPPDHLMRRCALAGLTRQQTADLTAYPIHAVHRAWQRLGLTERGRPSPYPEPPRVPIPEPPKPKMSPTNRLTRLVQLARKGIPATEIAEETGLTVTVVVRRMRTLGFTPTPSDTRASWQERQAREKDRR